jgi:hypothetical protein
MKYNKPDRKKKSDYLKKTIKSDYINKINKKSHQEFVYRNARIDEKINELNAFRNIKAPRNDFDVSPLNDKINEIFRDTVEKTQESVKYREHSTIEKLKELLADIPTSFLKFLLFALDPINYSKLDGLTREEISIRIANLLVTRRFFNDLF